LLRPSVTRLKPRKSPLQARSASSVDAILQATIQVLLAVGRERLTTTKVAHRAGVSVGTLYQYFPNKASLLQACLRRHLDSVAVAVEAACITYRGQALAQMASGVVNAFLEAKLRHLDASLALYLISSQVEGAAIARENGLRCTKVVAEMLATAHEQLASDPEVVAATLLASMAGVSRRLLESPKPAENIEGTRHELVLLATAYLEASGRAS